MRNRTHTGLSLLVLATGLPARGRESVADTAIESQPQPPRDPS